MFIKPIPATQTTLANQLHIGKRGLAADVYRVSDVFATAYR